MEASVIAALSAWARLVGSDPARAASVQHAWMQAADSAKGPIGGPITATQAALRRLGWSQTGPTTWRDSAGEVVSFLDLAELRDKIHYDFRKGEWARLAGRREDFSGAEAGVDEETTGHLAKKWCQQGRDRAAGALRCVLAGGTWPQSRKHKAGLADSPLCPHCRQEPETTLHRWWTCPAWSTQREEYGIADLAKIGAACQFHPICFWQNGILPQSAVSVPASRCMQVTEDPPDPVAPDLLDRNSLIDMWTDGASSDPGIRQLRRAGWGLWVPGCPQACAAEPLLGSCQTAQRAELRAFVAALERSDGFARIWTDSMFVVRGASHLQAGQMPPLRHQDLWRRALRAWCRGVSEVRWVKAHLTWPAAQQRGIAWQVWAGNQRADELAGLGAAQHAPPAKDATRVRQTVKDTERAQVWMAAALRLAADAAPTTGEGKRARRDGKGRVLTRQRRPAGPPGDHSDVVTIGAHWYCKKCRRRVKQSRGWRTWRRFPCVIQNGPLDRWVIRRDRQAP